MGIDSRTTMLSSADPVSLEGQDRTSSEKFHVIKPIPRRLNPGSDPGNDVAALQDSTQPDMSRTPVETASIPSAAAGSQSCPLDEDYELITRTEIDGLEEEYDHSLDWLSVKPLMTLFPLIPSTLSSTEPFRGYIKPSKADLKRVAWLRQNVRYLRLEIKGQKSFLQRAEEEFCRENEKLVKLMREWVAGHPKQAEFNLELVSKLFIASQSHRDECGPLVYEIDDMEERLAVEEAKLTKAEDNLHERFGISLDQPSQEFAEGTPRADSKATVERSETQHISQGNTGEISDEGEHSDVHSHSSSQSSFFSSTNYHPLYVEYQERVGDVNILLERCAMLWHNKAELEDQQETRQRVGLRLQKTDEVFLSNFVEISNPMETELAEAQNDVRQLKALCLEEGIVDEDDNYISNIEEVHGGSDAASSVKATSARGNSNISHHTIAVPKEADGNHTIGVQSARTPLVLRASLRGGAGEPEPLEEKEYQSRINPWLLDNLSCSKREVSLLVTILQADGKELDDDTYIDVLKFWETDGAGEKEPRRPGLLDSPTVEKLWKSIDGIRRAGYDSALVRNLYGISVWAKGLVEPRDHSMSYYVVQE